MVHQIREHAKLVAGQLDRRAVDRHFRRARIERQRAAAQLGGDVPARAPDQRTQPGQNFFHAKRLGDVIVGASVDALHLLVPAAARGQNQHRHLDTPVAPPAQQREPVDLRQAEIEEDRVVAFGLCQEIAALTVGRAVHDVAGVLQRRRELS